MVRAYTEKIFKRNSPFGDQPHKPGLWKVTGQIEAEDKYRGIPIPSLRLTTSGKLIKTAELHLFDRPELGPHFLLDIKEPESKTPDLVAVTIDTEFVRSQVKKPLNSRVRPQVKVFCYKPGVEGELEPHPQKEVILQRLAELFWHAGKNASEFQKQGKSSETYPSSLSAKALKRISIALIHAADIGMADKAKKIRQSNANRQPQYQHGPARK
ncbi:hypothetical protein HY994_04645 [Candidatus Micrarchaeota archaeon]|nr:hypothetical protein [Candidatus Micrarchaeota archaeon]